MNIIFGHAQAAALQEKHILLELDTVQAGTSAPITAFCVIENIPVENLNRVENMLTIHGEMIDHYKNRRWNHCLELIQKLRGVWGGDTDTFYDHLEARVRELIKTNPPEWSYIINKSVTDQ